MSEDSYLNKEERLKAENDFLKMKMMLEHGANFGSNDNNELPAEVENQFLNNVMAFERQFQERKTIKVFDKIGKPQHFKPVNGITDNEIEEAYRSVVNYLGDHGIGFDVCSPNITARELYRFITEELFDHEMDDMNLPGWTTNFIYDEFYPDPVYDNTRDAKDCINYILKKEPVEFMFHCHIKNLRLNNHQSLMEEECLALVNQYKLAYDELDVIEINESCCEVNEKDSCVKGTYNISAISGNETNQLSGNWQVFFDKDEEMGYWCINSIEIEGINF